MELEAVVQQNPRDHEAWYNLGLKQQENEREDQAIQALLRCIDLSPSSREAYLALAVSFTNEGEYLAANKMLDKWLNLGEDCIIDHANGGVADKGEDGRWEDGQKKLVERLIELARRDPERVDADVQVALGVLFNSSEVRRHLFSRWSKQNVF